MLRPGMINLGYVYTRPNFSGSVGNLENFYRIASSRLHRSSESRYKKSSHCTRIPDKYESGKEPGYFEFEKLRVQSFFPLFLCITAEVASNGTYFFFLSGNVMNKKWKNIFRLSRVTFSNICEDLLRVCEELHEHATNPDTFTGVNDQRILIHF